MAKKRMFSLDIIDTDLFLEMPQTSRLLYYELCMRADDDGFVGSPKKIQKMVGCSEDDFKVLIGKQFIIPFETGIVVIKHWKIHNYIQKDRYKETIYINEKDQLCQEENGMYTKCIQNGYTDKIRLELDKDSIDLVVVEKEKQKKEQQLQQLFIKCTSSTNLNAIEECISYLDDFSYEVIEIALKKTSEKNGGWKYAKTILQNWLNAGIKTIEQIQSEELNFKNNKISKEQNEQKLQERIERAEKRMEEQKNGNKRNL